VPSPVRKALCFLVLLAALPLAAQEQSWYLILLGGKRVGTQSETFWPQAAEGRRTEQFLRLTVSRFGQAFTIAQRQTWIEDEYLRSLESETDLNGERESLSARIRGQDLELAERRSGKASERVLPATGPLLGPRGAEDLLRAALAEAPFTPGSPRELSFRQFSPEAGAVHEVRLRLLGAGELADSLGVLHRGQRVDLESSAAPGVTTAAVYDERGGLQYSATRAGIILEVVRGDSGQTAGEAAAEAAGHAPELERFEMATLAIPVRWPGGSGSGTPRLEDLRAVIVRFTGPGLAELARAVQGRQVEPSGEGLVLTFEVPQPPPAWPQLPPAGAEATGDGFYLDLGDPRLEELAARCAPPDFACLERLVYRTIRAKSLRHGFAGVREVLDSRSGDCTEHALLLAALLRKRGVPARIAYGFLLTESGFIGHAWTEVRAGEGWFWLDPSFPGGRPYGFKLRLGTIDPAAPVWGQIGVSLLSVAGGVQAEVLEARGGR
jgi:hypothetical protein